MQSQYTGPSQSERCGANADIRTDAVLMKRPVSTAAARHTVHSQVGMRVRTSSSARYHMVFHDTPVRLGCGIVRTPLSVGTNLDPAPYDIAPPPRDT